MMDFNNPATLNTPLNDLYKILMVQRRHVFMEALEKWLQGEQRGMVSDHVLKARLWTYVMEISPLIRDKEGEQYAQEVNTRTRDAQTMEDYLTLSMELSHILYKNRILTVTPHISAALPHMGADNIVKVWNESEGVEGYSEGVDVN